MDFFKALLPCFPFTPDEPTISFSTKTPHPNTFLSEKTAAYPLKHASQPTVTIQQAADSIICALQDTEKAGPSLDVTIQSIVHQAGGWSEYLAAKIVSALEAVLKAGGEMKGPLKEAYDKACEEAKKIEGLAEDHPVATAVLLTVVALGVLVLLAPYVLDALGFAESGVIEGEFASPVGWLEKTMADVNLLPVASWAARWQATYRGYVPARSLFSYFQRLGMTWMKGYAM